MTDLVGLLRSLKAAWAERMEAHPAFAAPSLISALEEAATALEAKDKELAALKDSRDSYFRMCTEALARVEAALSRAETAERERDRIADELDTMNNNHRLMAKLLADTGRERDEARGAIKAIRETYSSSKGRRLPIIHEIEEIAARAITGEKQ
jgi:chromosome segregation ATPase